MLWFFLGGIRDDDRAALLCGLLEALNDDSVVKRSDIHDWHSTLGSGERDARSVSLAAPRICAR